jgi:hypothetical protein
MDYFGTTPLAEFCRRRGESAIQKLVFEFGKDRLRGLLHSRNIYMQISANELYFIGHMSTNNCTTSNLPELYQIERDMGYHKTLRASPHEFDDLNNDYAE